MKGMKCGKESGRRGEREGIERMEWIRWSEMNPGKVSRRNWRKYQREGMEDSEERTTEQGDTWTQWRQIFVEANLGCRS